MLRRRLAYVDLHTAYCYDIKDRESPAPALNDAERVRRPACSGEVKIPRRRSMSCSKMMMVRWSTFNSKLLVNVGSQQQTNLVPSLATSSSQDVSRITNLISVKLCLINRVRSSLYYLILATLAQLALEPLFFTGPRFATEPSFNVGLLFVASKPLLAGTLVVEAATSLVGAMSL
jgi:hypothetical protein